MHPSVRLEDPDAKCPICFMDLIPVRGRRRAVRAATPSSPSTRTRSPAPGSNDQRGGALLPRGRGPPVRQAHPDETRVARLTAWFPGRIERLFVNYVGVPVGRGRARRRPLQSRTPDRLRRVARGRALGPRGPEHVAGGASFLAGSSRPRGSDCACSGCRRETIEAAERGALRRGPLHRDLAHRRRGHRPRRAGGRLLETGDAIATVVDLSRLWLDLEAYESQLARSRGASAVTFTVEAHPGEVFEGRIAFIEPVVDERTRTAPCASPSTTPNVVSSRACSPRPPCACGSTPRARCSPTNWPGRWVAPMHPTIVEDGPGTCEVCGMDLVPAESLGVVGADPAANPARTDAAAGDSRGRP